jgi:hypothetical protein
MKVIVSQKVTHAYRLAQGILAFPLRKEKQSKVIENITNGLHQSQQISIGYFEATRGYVIYSPRRAAPW